MPSTPEKGDRFRPPLLDFAIVADLWVWGFMALYGPTYFGAAGVVATAMRGLGVLLLVVAIAGALFEIAKVFRSESLEFFGAGAAFLLPAIVLQVIVSRVNLTDTWDLIARVLVYLCVGIGAPLLFQGVPHMLWEIGLTRATKPNSALSSLDPDHPSSGVRTTERPAGLTAETLVKLVAALVVLVSSLLGLLKVVLELRATT